MPNSMPLQEILPLLDGEAERTLTNFKGWEIVYPDDSHFNVFYYFIVRGEIEGFGEILNCLKTQCGDAYDLWYIDKYTDSDWFEIQVDFGNRCVLRTRTHYIQNGHLFGEFVNFRAIPITKEEYAQVIQHVNMHKIGSE